MICNLVHVDVISPLKKVKNVISGTLEKLLLLNENLFVYRLWIIIFSYLYNIMNNSI